MTLTAAQKSAPRIHWAWVVAAVSFVAILGAAGFRLTRVAAIPALSSLYYSVIEGACS